MPRLREFLITNAVGYLASIVVFVTWWPVDELRGLTFVLHPVAWFVIGLLVQQHCNRERAIREREDEQERRQAALDRERLLWWNSQAYVEMGPDGKWLGT